MRSQPACVRRQPGRTADAGVACALCPWLCRLQEGERGACGIRTCRNGELVLERPGYLDALRVEPVEAHSLSHFLPGTLVLSLGRSRSNLRSRFELNGERRDPPSADAFADLLEPKAVPRFVLELNCPSVALGATDPAVAPEDAARIAEACRIAGLRTLALTRGYMCPVPRAQLFRRIDAARVELFAFKERFYWKYCNAHIAPVLDTLAYLATQTRVWLEIAVPLIPGENDTVGEIERLARWVSDDLGPEVPLHFKISHLIAARGPDELRRAEVSAARAQRVARTNGVRHAYTDDLFDPRGRTTACHRCGTPLIRREWYQVSGWNLTDDRRCALRGRVRRRVRRPSGGVGRGAAWARDAGRRLNGRQDGSEGRLG